jgi:hypothetical protein
VPKRHAELLEIDLGQLRQDIGVDITRAKQRLILSEAEASEPTPDIHHRAPGSERIIVRLKRPVQRRAVKELGWPRSGNPAQVGSGTFPSMAYPSSLALGEVANPRMTKIA